MLSRRSIRIKVLQALYSQIIGHSIDSNETIKIYDATIEQVLETNLCFLLYCKEVFRYITEYAAQQEGKFLIDIVDKNVNTTILNTHFYKYLNENVEFLKQIKKYKVEQYIQSEYVRSMFFDLINLKEYKKYIKSPSIASEKLLLDGFIKIILFKNEQLISYLESNFANIDEDADLVNFSLKRNFKEFELHEKMIISLGFKECKQLEEFAHDLIKVTLVNHQDYMKYIEPNLVGWILDRIPVLDITIIKMAISEMLYFPTIPLKVTVNEYIDLAKLFCSQKSKIFVNGIMHKLMKDFDDKKMINKIGRGLD